MLKNICELEFVYKEKVCRFQCDNDTDISIIKEALFQFNKFIGGVEDQVKFSKEQEQVPSPNPVESPKTE